MTTSRLLWLAAWLGWIVGAWPPANAATIAPGAGAQTAVLGDQALPVFTYRPEGCAITGALLVFHGMGRNAATYRDDARPLADRLCRVVVAPLFDRHRFPPWRYQRGGLAGHGDTQPEAQWTVALVPRLVAWTRAAMGSPTLPYALLGHSAGAQFLSRVAAYGAVADATRIVIANPSTWVWPDPSIAAPYGFAGLPADMPADAALRRYLAKPVTVLLGETDTGSAHLVRNRQAEAQGPTRLARGEAVFRQAEAVAHAHGWTFGWRLVLVPGVGHDAGRMFASAQAAAALSP